MAKGLEIKRIDLLVHPFYYQEKARKQLYGKKEAEFLLNLWKEHIDKVAKDPNRLLFITVQSQGFFQETGSTVSEREMRSEMADRLVDYAEKKLGKRFAVFAEPGQKFITLKDCRGRFFNSFREYKKANGFKTDPKSLKTSGMGEYRNQCVIEYLTALNRVAGLKNIIPYQNRQSMVLARKSVSGGKKEYPMPWELKDLNKTTKGKETLRKWMQKYIRERRKNANKLAERHKKKPFKPRKKRRIA